MQFRYEAITSVIRCSTACCRSFNWLLTLIIADALTLRLSTFPDHRHSRLFINNRVTDHPMMASTAGNAETHAYTRELRERPIQCVIQTHRKPYTRKNVIIFSRITRQSHKLASSQSEEASASTSSSDDFSWRGRVFPPNTHTHTDGWTKHSELWGNPGPYDSLHSSSLNAFFCHCRVMKETQCNSRTNGNFLKRLNFEHPWFGLMRLSKLHVKLACLSNDGKILAPIPPNKFSIFLLTGSHFHFTLPLWFSNVNIQGRHFSEQHFPLLCQILTAVRMI